MNDFQLTKENLGQFISQIVPELDKNESLVISIQSAKTGKWTMTRLWRVWMATTAEWMYQNGCIMPLMVKQDGSHYGSRPFDQNDAHELFSAKWLGVDKDGTRLSWSKKGRDGMRPATKGERFIAMMRHEEWGSVKGITLLQPRDSEYKKLTDEQNGQ